ncbi:EVE domain-containing protein [Patescibacteria group bacterium]|nr:EVE domain-containing protein [Patescibacteria group bacterium]
MNYWLLKSEGDCYSIDDLKKDKKTAWTGVRNYQARNFMRDSMKVGDGVLFYHSNATPTGVYGIAKIVSTPHADETQFDIKDDHYDLKSKKENPTWVCVDIGFVKKFDEPVSLTEIKIDPALDGMMVRATGSRLSVQPVSEKHFTYIAEVLGK